MKETEIRRGDIFSYDFGTRIGSIQSGVRPVLVIQADNFNANAPTVIVASITSVIKKRYLPSHIILGEDFGLTKPSMVLLEQIQTVNKDDLTLLRAADVIMLEELRSTGYYDKTWQAFTVLLNVKSVGVMGDNRTYDNTVCVRIVDATDGMTATFAHIPHTILENISRRIINEVNGINRVVYDISSKPPATIEWE